MYHAVKFASLPAKGLVAKVRASPDRTELEKVNRPVLSVPIGSSSLFPVQFFPSTQNPNPPTKHPNHHTQTTTQTTTYTIENRDALDDQTLRRRKAFTAAVIGAVAVLSGRKSPEPIHPGGPKAAVRKAKALLSSSEVQFQQLFRMPKRVFKLLVQWLRDHTDLEDTRYLTAKLKVMVALWIFGHNEDQRNAANMFMLHTQFVRPNEDGWLDPSIELDPKLNFFNGYIGAIDGTHILAYVRGKKQ
ncbi:hypothetical protein QBC41DRAFT_137372 [Cercophora samala]|uniref:DUF8040 domain-containing protein n=1 Tax=Cercophora samala TaxID=330535 RepID=A0AA40D913_9PEZI|nr:hypothetical protein QBC41DRAFT_137372 [Cercophora samala]